MMREAIQKWLKKRGLPEIDVENTQGMCDKLGLEGDKYDSCIALVWQLEKGDINDNEFMVELSVLANKEPEEVVGILKGVRAVTPVTQEVTAEQSVGTRWLVRVKELDNIRAKDGEYRSILSTAGKIGSESEKRVFAGKSTWRDEVIRLANIDLKRHPVILPVDIEAEAIEAAESERGHLE